MKGYTSTSKSRQVALEFAIDDLEEGKMAVIYEIEFTGSRGIFFMSSREFTAHREEQEVLLQDGLEFKITSVQESQVDEQNANQNVPLKVV